MRRYRDRAEECRAHAAEMKDPTARAGLLQVAQNYERMADAIERALGDDAPPHSDWTRPMLHMLFSPLTPRYPFQREEKTKVIPQPLKPM